MRFPYAWYEVEPSATAGGSTDLYRPEIPFRLIGTSDDAFLLGLLDTGADETLIGRSVAEEVGAAIDETVSWDAQGFTGDVLQVRLAHVEIEVADEARALRWAVAVGVVDYAEPTLEQVSILGHAGFLQFFDAQFLGAEREVVLEPNRSLPQ